MSLTLSVSCLRDAEHIKSHKNDGGAVDAIVGRRSCCDKDNVEMKISTS